MKKTIKIFTAIMFIICTFCCLTGNAFAAETNNTVESNLEKSIETRATNNVIYPDETTVRLTKTVSKVTYTGTHGLFGSDGVVVLRFTNTATGDSRSYTFICDGSTYSNKSLGLNPYEAGTYRITVEANTVSQFRELLINFS